MSTSDHFTAADAVIVLNKALRLEPSFQEGMAFEEIEILGRLLTFRAKSSLEPAFAATYKKVASEWFPNYTI